MVNIQVIANKKVECLGDSDSMAQSPLASAWSCGSVISLMLKRAFTLVCLKDMRFGICCCCAFCFWAFAALFCSACTPNSLSSLSILAAYSVVTLLASSRDFMSSTWLLTQPLLNSFSLWRRLLSLSSASLFSVRFWILASRRRSFCSCFSSASLSKTDLEKMVSLGAVCCSVLVYSLAALAPSWICSTFCYSTSALSWFTSCWSISLYSKTFCVFSRISSISFLAWFSS